MPIVVHVLFPRPTDIDAFHQTFEEAHMPLIMEHLEPADMGITVFGGAPDGEPKYHLMLMMMFPDGAALEAKLGGEGAAKVMAHGKEISTGGAPVVLYAEFPEEGEHEHHEGDGHDHGEPQPAS